MEELKERLMNRGTDSMESIKGRLDIAKKEIKEAEEFLLKLGFANEIVIVKDEKEVPQNAVSIVVDELKVFIPFEELVDIEEERKRLEGEKAKLEAEVLRGEKMLSNPGFVNKAPETKINEEKAKLAKYKEMLERSLLEAVTNESSHCCWSTPSVHKGCGSFKRTA